MGYGWKKPYFCIRNIINFKIFTSNKVEKKLMEIKSIENIDIYLNYKNELGIKFTDRTPIAYLKDSNSLIDISGNIFNF